MSEDNDGIDATETIGIFFEKGLKEAFQETRLGMYSGQLRAETWKVWGQLGSIRCKHNVR